MSQSLFFAGAVPGLVFFGWFSDAHGRVPAIVLRSFKRTSEKFSQSRRWPALSTFTCNGNGSIGKVSVTNWFPHKTIL